MNKKPRTTFEIKECLDKIQKMSDGFNTLRAKNPEVTLMTIKCYAEEIADQAEEIYATMEQM